MTEKKVSNNKHEFGQLIFTRKCFVAVIRFNRIDDEVLGDVNADVRAAVTELFALFPHYAPGMAAPTPI